MKTMPARLQSCWVLTFLLLMAVPALANSAVSFTFNSLQVNEQVLGYYAGGTGSLGSGPGPNYGITFSPNAIVAPGKLGNLAVGSGTIVLNAGTLFANSLKFAYVAVAPEVVDIWSGYGGTGTLLSTMTLMPNRWCHNLSCGWSHALQGFSGTAASITFSGPAGQFGIGSIKIGGHYWVKPQIPATAIMGRQLVVTPEPSSLLLLFTGLLGLFICRKDRILPRPIGYR